MKAKNMKFEIEKNIPIPEHKVRNSKYPFADMEIGDSILSESPHTVMSAYQYGKRHNKKFMSRKINNNYRIWRVV